MNETLKQTKRQDSPFLGAMIVPMVISLIAPMASSMISPASIQ